MEIFSSPKRFARFALFSSAVSWIVAVAWLYLWLGFFCEMSKSEQNFALYWGWSFAWTGLAFVLIAYSLICVCCRFLRTCDSFCGGFYIYDSGEGSLCGFGGLGGSAPFGYMRFVEEFFEMGLRFFTCPLIKPVRLKYGDFRVEQKKSILWSSFKIVPNFGKEYYVLYPISISDKADIIANFKSRGVECSRV